MIYSVASKTRFAKAGTGAATATATARRLRLLSVKFHFAVDATGAADKPSIAGQQ